MISNKEKVLNYWDYLQDYLVDGLDNEINEVKPLIEKYSDDNFDRIEELLEIIMNKINEVRNREYIKERTEKMLLEDAVFDRKINKIVV